MGQRFRLKADVDISGYPAPVVVILRALKKYGMFLADNGSSPVLVRHLIHQKWMEVRPERSRMRE